MPVIKSSKWSSLARLAPHLHRYRLRIGIGFLCIVGTNAFFVATPWITKYAVDSLYQSITRQKLVYYAGIIIGIAILEGIFRFFARWLLIGVSRQIEYTLRNDLFRHLETLS